MNETVIGHCSICGGTVVVPSVWWGVIPPTPHCTKCGAVADTRGPEIPMRPVKRWNSKYQLPNDGW